MKDYVIENRGKIDLMRSQLSLFRREVVDMIRTELHEGHNLYGRFDPYPGWDSCHLYGYVIEGKDMKVEENVEGVCLVLTEDGYEPININLECEDFPISVLLEIYNQLK